MSTLGWNDGKSVVENLDGSGRRFLDETSKDSFGL